MTNRIVLRTPEQFMADYAPVYNPMYPALLANSQAYSQQAGNLTFRRLEAVGDLRNKPITPKDTEMHQIAVREGTKSFKKFFLGSQYVSSQFQDNDGWEDVMRQVLDEHQIHMDELALGDGINNGLYTSTDSNYTLESSTEVLEDANDNYLADLHTKVMITADKANQVAGSKLLIFYGANIVPLFDGVYPSAATPFKTVLSQVLGPNYNVIKMPTQCTPNSAHGWMIVNLDQIKFHYTALPGLDGQGQNDEKKYLWANFIMGSCMVDVKAANGIIRQPATLSAL